MCRIEMLFSDKKVQDMISKENKKIERGIAEKISIPRGRLDMEMAMWCPIVRSLMGGETFEEARLREYVAMKIQADPDHAEEIKADIRKILGLDK